MWFRNLQLYRLPKNWAGQSSQLEEHLATLTLQPCGASAAQSLGWVPPCAGGGLVHVVNRQYLLALGAEQKLLPTSVVRQFADERAKAIEEVEGRRVGRKEMRELREAMTIELLPSAFIGRRTTFGWIDPINGWLVIDAAAPAKAEEFLEQLRKAVAGLPATLVKVTQSPSAAMTGWVAAGEAPGGFTLDQDLELCSAENAKVRYVKHSLEGEEIGQHIAKGKVVTRLALTWGERISFLLNEKLEIKRLAFLDILKEEADGQAENEDERFDLDFTLMSGELARLLDDLIAALGGELASAA
jgi:recombination associated protein RdgC